MEVLIAACVERTGGSFSNCPSKEARLMAWSAYKVSFLDSCRTRQHVIVPTCRSVP